MTFSYDDSFAPQHELEGYERLSCDAMLGDQTLFTRADGIERLWEVSTPLLEDPPQVEPYEPGSWGPTRRRADRAAPLVPAGRVVARARRGRLNRAP